MRLRGLALPAQHCHTRVRVILAVACLTMILGCPPRVASPILEPIDQRTAVGIVNRNIERINETLRAGGTADGYFTTPDGKRRSFSLSAVLFFRPPRYLRFDMKSFTQSELLVGSNDTHYWIRTTRGESWYAVRRHDAPDPVMLQGPPIDPGQLIESLGLTPIPSQYRDRKGAASLRQSRAVPSPVPVSTATVREQSPSISTATVREQSPSISTATVRERPIQQSRDRKGAVLSHNPVLREGQRTAPPVQRIVDEYQQLLFIIRDDAGRILIEKEYWLDRRAPRLIRRVIFRDAEGSLEMEAELDDYAPLIGTDLILPGRVSVHWPSSGAKMDFHIKEWRFEPRATPTGRQFTPPDERGLRFDHEDIQK